MPEIKSTLRTRIVSCGLCSDNLLTVHTYSYGFRFDPTSACLSLGHHPIATSVCILLSWWEREVGDESNARCHPHPRFHADLGFPSQKSWKIYAKRPECQFEVSNDEKIYRGSRLIPRAEPCRFLESGGGGRA
jgi:hypothetical protein